MAKKGEKILTQNRVIELGLNEVSVITADMIDGYTNIGNYAFYNCSRLIPITIPDSVTSIRDHAFLGCIGLTSIEIPNSVISIGESAFENCSGLTSIILPNGVTRIGNYAFWGCSDLTSVIIPNSVTSIGGHAFKGCSSLAYIIVENGNSFYDSRNNCNAIIETATNTLIIGCKNTIIPNSVTRIEDSAFYNCWGLASIEIPNSVISIRDHAFLGCIGLTSIEIPNSVISIGYCAFFCCRSLTSVTIPDSITNIGSAAFDGCNGLTSVTIGDKKYKTQKVGDGKCKAYKAFNSDMTCRGFKYEEGETYELDGEPILCVRGFHACLILTDVFNYYDGEIGKDVVVREVELEGVSSERNDDGSKVVAKKITIGKRIL